MLYLPIEVHWSSFKALAYTSKNRSFRQFPGQEEFADIKKAPEAEDLEPDQKKGGIGLLRPLPNPNRTDIVMATANPYIEHSISHNIGVYVWGFYQVPPIHQQKQIVQNC